MFSLSSINCETILSNWCKTIYTLFVYIISDMSIDTLAPGSGRGRGCGRGAPFGNNEQRRELR